MVLEARLPELNLGVSQAPDLPPDDLCRIIAELFDQDDYDDHNESKADASGMVSMSERASVEAALKASQQTGRRRRPCGLPR